MTELECRTAGTRTSYRPPSPSSESGDKPYWEFPVDSEFSKSLDESLPCPHSLYSQKDCNPLSVFEGNIHWMTMNAILWIIKVDEQDGRNPSA